MTTMKKAILSLLLFVCDCMSSDDARAQNIPSAARCSDPFAPSDEIASACTQVIESQPATNGVLATALYNRGSAHARKSDYDAAINDFTESIRLNPRYAKAYIARCVSWANKGRIESAIADCDQAIEMSPPNALAYIDRGLIWSKASDARRAVADFSEAIRIDPLNADAYLDRGMVLAKEQDYDHAMADLSDAIRLNPTNSEALRVRGRVLLNLGEYDRATRDLGDAIELNPMDGDAYGIRAIAMQQAGNCARALSDIDRAVALSQNDFRMRRLRGVVRFAQGQYEGASADFADTLQQRAGDTYLILWHLLAQLHAGQREIGDLPIAESVRKFAAAHWAAPIVELLSGRTEVDDVLQRTAKAQVAQPCKVAFFVGEWYIFQDRRADARMFLEQAVRTCSKSALESFAASAELSRISLRPEGH